MHSVFTITPRVIAHLGEALIKNESIAVLELVKNSYDANATECEVFFEFDKNTSGKFILEKIIISDNGSGMDLDTIKNNWLVIGTDNKKKKYEKERNIPNVRLPLGEKGIGRLGVHKLGYNIKLITRMEKTKEISIDIDWRKLESISKISDFEIDFQENEKPLFFKRNKHGTRLEITSLKSEWDNKKIRDIYRNLIALNSPFDDNNDNFSVTVKSNNDIFLGLPTFNEIKNVGMYFAHCTMKGSQITEFNYSFEPWNTLDKVKTGRKVTLRDLKKKEINLTITGIKEIEDESGKIKEQEYIIDLDKTHIGQIDFDIIIFEPDTQIISFMNLEKKAFRDYMKANGGIRVYRDNIRIYNYGEPDDDWLGINEKRIHRVGSNPGNQNILGAVRISRAESYGLIEKTNREGFIENDAYIDLVNAIQFALSRIILERNCDKALLSTLYKKEKVIEPVLSDLNELKELIEKKVKNSEEKDEMLKYISRIDSQYSNVKDTLLVSANVGINLGAIVHEIEKQVKMLQGNIISNDISQVKLITERLDSIIRKASSLLKRSDRKQQSLNKAVESVLSGFKYRFEDHKIELVYNCDSSNIESYFSISAVNSSLTNLLDNSIFWLTYVRRKNPKISVYITTQLQDYNCIIVSDNGPGFSIPESIAVEPFISGKPNNMGTGLGLHICKELMKANNGKLEFCNENDYDFPKEIKTKQITKAFICLCLPKKKE